MIIIQVKVNGQNMTKLSGRDLIATGNIGSFAVQFTFDSNWDDLIKTAVFWHDQDSIVKVIIPESNQIVIPTKVLQKRTFYIGVCGNGSEDEDTYQISARPLFMRLDGGTLGVNTEEVIPSMYQQILTKIAEVNDKIPEDITDDNWFKKTSVDYYYLNGQSVYQCLKDDYDYVVCKSSTYSEMPTEIPSPKDDMTFPITFVKQNNYNYLVFDQEQKFWTTSFDHETDLMSPFVYIFNMKDTVTSSELESIDEKYSTWTKDVTVNGTSVLNENIASVIVPTKTSEITNDSDFATNKDVSNEYYNKTSIDDKISTINQNVATKQKILTESDKQTIADMHKDKVTSVNGYTGDVIIQEYDDTGVKNRLTVIENQESTWNSKQNAISDLETIRSGANKGSTAIQDSSYVHTDNNYTSQEKTKLAGLSNYDDTEVKSDISGLKNSKVGYAEYSDDYLYLYSDNTKVIQIAKVYIENGTEGAITEEKCREIVESYGYAVASDFYSKTDIDSKFNEVVVTKDSDVTDNTKIEIDTSDIHEYTFAEESEIDEINDNITNLKAEIDTKVDKASLAKTDRSLDALWKLNKGISYSEEEDTTEAYQKDVPSGAKAFTLESYGGHSEVSDDGIINADVDEIEIMGKNLFDDDLATAQQGIKTGKSYYFDGTKNIDNQRVYVSDVTKFGMSYGETYTVSLDCENHSSTGTIDLRTGYGWMGLTSWVTIAKISANTKSRVSMTQTFNNKTWFPMFIGNYKADNNPYTISNIQIEKGSSATNYSEHTVQDITIPQSIRDLPGYGVSGNTVDILTKTYTQTAYIDGTEVKTLDTPIVTDISDMLTDELTGYTDCEGGGTITFKQSDDTEIPVPSSETYIISLAEVTT